MDYVAVNPSRRHTRLIFPLGCLCFIAYFAFHTVAGEYGLAFLQKYRESAAQFEREQVRLNERIAYFENRIDLMEGPEVDRDIAEELVRKHLGYPHQNDVLIPVPDRATD